jgi:predicted membrane protein
MLAVLITVAMAQTMWRLRRTAALGLALGLGIFTFDLAVHSVHHLSEPENAAECLVFSASQHVSGTLVEPGDVHALVLAVTAASPENCNLPIDIFRFRPELPRAPPSLSS